MAVDAAILSALGPNGVVTDSRPEEIETFPTLAYTDDSQSDLEWADNKPQGTAMKFIIDIFTKVEQGLPTTTDIAIPVAKFFTDLFFYCARNGEVPDDTVGVRHRVMVFTREVFALESH